MSQPSLSQCLRRSSIPPVEHQRGPGVFGDVRAVGGKAPESPRGAVIKKSCEKEKGNKNEIRWLLGEFHLCPLQLLRPVALAYTL